MMVWLDEIGENYRKLKVIHDQQDHPQARGGQKEMYVPMELGHVTSKEVRRGSMCYKRSHLLRDCRKKGKGKWKGGDGDRVYANGEDETAKGTGKKGSDLMPEHQKVPKRSKKIQSIKKKNICRQCRKRRRDSEAPRGAQAKRGACPFLSNKNR